MERIDSFLVLVAFVIFLVSGYLPTTFYIYAFTNMVFPAALLLTLLGTSYYSRIGSICLALAFVSLFVEFRKRVIEKQPPVEMNAYAKVMAPAPPLVPNEIHPEPMEASGNTVRYRPTEDASNNFTAVGTSIDSKVVLPGERSTEKFLISQGLV
jgi:hypothetical protein